MRLLNTRKLDQSHTIRVSQFELNQIYAALYVFQPYVRSWECGEHTDPENLLVNFKCIEASDVEYLRDSFGELATLLG